MEVKDGFLFVYHYPLNKITGNTSVEGKMLIALKPLSSIEHAFLTIDDDDVVRIQKPGKA